MQAIMKKLSAVLLIIILFFGLMGCKSNDTNRVAKTGEVAKTSEVTNTNEVTKTGEVAQTSEVAKTSEVTNTNESLAGNYVSILGGSLSFELKEDGLVVSTVYGNGKWSVSEGTVNIAYMGGSVLRNYLISGSYLVQTDLTCFGTQIPSEGTFDGVFDIATERYKFFSDGRLTIEGLNNNVVEELTYERNGDLLKLVFDDGKEKTFLIYDGGINDSSVMRGN